jgi:hydroxyacylglutathione hydrolase
VRRMCSRPRQASRFRSRACAKEKHFLWATSRPRFCTHPATRPSSCIPVTDHTRGEEPWFVLSGHTLMVGDFGRTELATSAEEGAKRLFRSARRLKELPDDLEVLPGAYAGSVCGRQLSGKPWSTIGFEKRHNQALMIEDEAEFVRFMVAEIPPAPPEAAKIRAANSAVTAAAA